VLALRFGSVKTGMDDVLGVLGVFSELRAFGVLGEFRELGVFGMLSEFGLPGLPGLGGLLGLPGVAFGLGPLAGVLNRWILVGHSAHCDRLTSSATHLPDLQWRHQPELPTKPTPRE
jgi:hypothetical protein